MEDESVSHNHGTRREKKKKKKKKRKKGSGTGICITIAGATGNVVIRAMAERLANTGQAPRMRQ